MGEQDAPQEATSAPPRGGPEPPPAGPSTSSRTSSGSCAASPTCRPPGSWPTGSAARPRSTSSPGPASTRSRSSATSSRWRSPRSGSSSTGASSPSSSSARTATASPRPRRRPAFRPVILTINAETTDLRALIRVTLALGEEQAVGFAEGSVASSARHRLVAGATLDALRQLASTAEAVDVDSAQIVRVGPHDVAVVTVVYVAPPLEQVVSGSAIVRLNAEADAVAARDARRHQPAPAAQLTAPPPVP